MSLFVIIIMSIAIIFVKWPILVWSTRMD